MSRTWLLLIAITLCVKMATASYASISADTSASSDCEELSITRPHDSTPRPTESVSASKEGDASKANEDTKKDGASKAHEESSFFAYTAVPEMTFDAPTNGAVPPNWVGPSIGDMTDMACYRKTHKKNSMDGCPNGYNYNGHKCWAQCPIAYPVQCLAECIPQNDDCVLEIMSKVTNLGYVTLNMATAGVFNAIYKTFKTVKKGLMCAFNVFNIAEGISRFMRFRQMMTPNSTKEEILAMVYQTDLFLVDLPVAVGACLGYDVPKSAYVADAVVTGVETIVKQLMINHNLIMSSADAFMRFFRNTTAGNSTRDLDAESIANLTSLIDSRTRCGFELKRLTDRVVAKVADIRDDDPSATNDDIRTEMSKSSLVLSDVPTSAIDRQQERDDQDFTERTS
ncbi:hypothetical protein PRIC2_007757 [Phytophthora ramorum]